MKIKFIFEVSSFIDAAEVEELLNTAKVKYKVDIEGKTAKKINNVGRRKPIDKIEFAAVVLSIKQNPDWSDNTVGKSCGVSGATVSRIRSGSHALQQH